ncbi:MFS transporter [Rhodopseudomonas sp. HC1]|uniref:MFS transporter n=1 Tax=Rhodopseudomonas infernalis TaxID=2897386 RepID=UPI001EE864FE|nr:MFS transporter [Rhodopseudomonas infernalis]MCG6207804.1 MFS transporter [Rhodopseudomonas infernalis]
MIALRRLLAGPGRAVVVLAFTQILCWGILIYPPVLTMPPLTADRGWTLAFGMAGFSLALVISGIMSPIVGGLIDRHGGHVVMAPGALIGALGMALIALGDAWPLYFVGWALIGAAMASSLYDPAFATLARLFGSSARRQIILVTFAGGFASTVGWPATHLLLQHVGWRGTYLVFAAVLAFVVAPLHGFALPRAAARSEGGLPSNPHPVPQQALRPEGRPFLLLATAFALHALILSGVTSNLLAMLERGGLSGATAVTVGALFGPAQVAARLLDFLLAGRTHPLWIARGAIALMGAAFAMLAFVGVSVTVAALFCIAFGAANGVMTIARGGLPLLMFGPEGYGRVIGRIARPALFVQASAPFVVAAAVERFSDAAVIEIGMLAALAGTVCFLLIKPPPAMERR